MSEIMGLIIERDQLQVENERLTEENKRLMGVIKHVSFLSMARQHEALGRRMHEIAEVCLTIVGSGQHTNSGEALKEGGK